MDSGLKKLSARLKLETRRDGRVFQIDLVCHLVVILNTALYRLFYLRGFTCLILLVTTAGSLTLSCSVSFSDAGNPLK